MNPNMPLFYKEEISSLLITIYRRMMIILTYCVPILYYNAKNEEILAEQNSKMNSKDFDVFEVLRSAIEYINPVLFAVLKDEKLRFQITKNAKPTAPNIFRVASIRVLIFQENDTPQLVIFGSHDSCITEILDVLRIPHKDKTIDVIAFEYFSLNYILLIKSKTYHNLSLNVEDCLIEKKATFYSLAMESIQLTTTLLHFSRFAVVHANQTQNVNCTHGCNFLRPSHTFQTDYQPAEVLVPYSEIEPSSSVQNSEPSTSAIDPYSELIQFLTDSGNNNP